MSDQPQPPRQAEPDAYEPTTGSPIVYLPVMLGGRHVGYLWAGEDDRSASFIRRNEFLDEAFETPFVWIRRLREAHARGLPARQAIREWIGAPEDPVGGAVPAGACEETGRMDELRALANPGERRPPWATLDEDLFGAGAQSGDLEDLVPPAAEGPMGYRLEAEGPIRYLPVVRDGVILGYLWASAEEGAAMYLRRADAGLDGGNAGVPWIVRLRELYAAGVPAEQILARCQDMPADERAGGVPRDAKEQDLPGLEELKSLASGYEQSMRVSFLPADDDPQVAERPPLPPEEREAVLRYLREAPVVYEGGTPFPDDFEPGRPARIPAAFHTDGTWVWLGGVAHHLDVHGIPPEPDLLEHVRANGFRVPAVDPAAEERARRTLAWTGFLVPPPEAGEGRR